VIWYIQNIFCRPCLYLDSKRTVIGISIVDPNLIFLGSGSNFSDNSDPGGSGSGSCFRSYMNGTKLFNINFTFECTSCKCVRLHITTRYKLFRGFFPWKRNSHFLN
jgi:hypothetical protein